LIHKVFNTTSLLIVLLIKSNAAFASDEGPTVNSPSFDCQKAATEVEHKICSSNLLSGLDVWMAYVYQLSITKGDKKKIKTEQIAWLKTRKSCLNKPRDSLFGSSQLESCYVDRIIELIKENNIKRDREFYIKLAQRMAIDIPENFTNKATEFVFFKNLNESLDGFFNGHCRYNATQVMYYKPPILITKVNGSNVCGGISRIITDKTEYCEKDKSFHQGSIWTCKPENLTDKDFLLGYIAVNSFENFINEHSNQGNNLFIDYLYSFPIHSLAETSASHGRYSRVFSDQFIKLLEDNFQTLLPIAEQHQAEFKEVLSGMSCTLKHIKRNQNWKEIFKSSPSPESLGRYWHGRQFTGCNTYDKRIAGQFYTYKELYIQLWRHLYLAGGMERAIKLLDQINSADI